MLRKEGRSGLQCLASLICIEILESSTEHWERDKKFQNELSRLLRSLLPCPFFYFQWTIEVLVGFHLMELFFGIMLDKQPKPNHFETESYISKLLQTNDGAHLGDQFQRDPDTCTSSFR